MNDVKFPIVPLRTYNYDPRLAGYGQDRLGKYDSGPREMWEADGRIRGANVIYGLVKWQGSREQWWSADCGLVWWTMYDFCGGAVVSSAFVDVRAGIYPCGIGRGPQQKEPLKITDPDVIIDAQELTGEVLNERKVVKLLELSLLSALITDLARYGRCGAVVGDRVRSGRTAPILERASTMERVPFYSHLRRPYYAPEVSSPWLCEVAVRATTGPSYLNRNSGNTVAFTMMDFDTHDTRRVESHLPYHLPEKMWRGLQSDEFAAMCPQSLFHN